MVLVSFCTHTHTHIHIYNLNKYMQIHMFENHVRTHDAILSCWSFSISNILSATMRTVVAVNRVGTSRGHRSSPISMTI